MKCVMCNRKTAIKTVQHKESGIALGNYKANVCEKCNEVYFDESTVDKIQKKSKELGLFGLSKKATVAEIGNSIAIRVPKEIVNFMNLKKGKEVILQPISKRDLNIHS